MQNNKVDAILISNANFSSSAGNVTLVLRRAEALFNVYGIYTHIFVFMSRYSKSIIPTEGDYYSISYIENWKELKKRIIKKNSRLIILYGDKVELLTYPIHKIIKKNKLCSKVILDVQSCVEEKKEYAKGFFRKLLYPAYLIAFKKAINDVDAAFVVSDELIQNCNQKRKNKKPISYYKIRCGITQLFCSDELYKNREVVRKQLGIPLDATVFVYSGYRTAWQRVDDIIRDFSEYDRLLDNVYFLFLCNIDDQFENKLKAVFPKGNYSACFLGKSEYFKVLSSCDIGYILRCYDETNRVAFPNKFSDYLSSGLLLAMNSALSEPMRLLREKNLPIINTDDRKDENINIINKYVENRHEYIADALELCRTELLYDSQVRKIDIL